MSKKEIKDKLAKTLKVKEECISIFGMKTKFGGGRSSGFALVYDSLDARKQYDSRPNLLRVSMTGFRGSSLFETYGTHASCFVWPTLSRSILNSNIMRRAPNLSRIKLVC